MINMEDTPDVAAWNKGMQVKDASADVVNRSYNTIAIQTRTITSDTREKGEKSIWQKRCRDGI
ncbi:MAG TPA: hypothetical protein VFJ51_00175 [Nitrososphaeraceae archaeon]|nr:hypothetical protein [Nitrososphaeraceae archaeon]